MRIQLAVAIVLHQLGVLVWIGGMFFSHVVLRPALQQLEPPQRLATMRDVLRRFFTWVWLAILSLWISGLWVWLGIAGGKMPAHVHAMAAIALVMTIIFAYLFFGPYRKFRTSVDARDWVNAAAALVWVRRIVLVNLVLGLLTTLLGAAGSYLH